MPDDSLWRAKLWARLHGPSERRDGATREGDAAGVPGDELFEGDPPDAVRRAREWAAAADLPRLPDAAAWAEVDWTGSPVLIHPLSGSESRFPGFAGAGNDAVEARSRAHFEALIVRAGGELGANAGVDWWKTLLAWWRFGPEPGVTGTNDDGRLDALWPHLPADARFPDQPIWDHLDLTSAFTGAFTADPDDEAALLALAIGPVQPFIAAARSTSDLWAGSHLLARLSWEAMRVVCEQLGPDALLFPRLRGIPQVDLWLRDECGLPREWFRDCDWTRDATDANPLFAAALPNRFVAVVPASAAANIPATIESCVRDWLKQLGGAVVDDLLEAARLKRRHGPRDESVHAYRQMGEQLAGFPEVHWAAVPFSLVRARQGAAWQKLDTARLAEAMGPFFGARGDEKSGFLQSAVWGRLQKEMRWRGGHAFHAPNTGVLYPALYDLAERVLAAAKAVRPFEQTEHYGWRCSLTGETEWLTTDPSQLGTPSGRRTGTLWMRVADRKPALARQGEHLGALPAVKRLWPSRFAREVGAAFQGSGQAAAADRFVVSTHTMALAAQIDHWLERGGVVSADLRDALARLEPRPSALPRRTARRHRKSGSFDVATKLPGLLEIVREGGDEAERRRIERVIRDALGLRGGIETYYALLLMDGDHMGRILSGDEKHAITYARSVHPDVRPGLRHAAQGCPEIGACLEGLRAMSANRHLAISATLNDFALQVVPEVVEGEHLGRVLYAGGDDVLAMLPAADLLSAMGRLRHAYGGGDRDDQAGTWPDEAQARGLFCRNGFASLDGRLMRMMGGATASCGAVIVHYLAPLPAVLRELRGAEHSAKSAGRNRFTLNVVKRSGGSLSLTAGWGEPLRLLRDVSRFLREPGVSRRAVYHTLAWLRGLPDDKDMLGSMMAYQFDRQTSDKAVRDRHDLSDLASRLAGLAAGREEPGAALVPGPEGDGDDVGPGRGGGRSAMSRLGNFLAIAEFIARETRSPADAERGAGGPRVAQGAAG